MCWQCERCKSEWSSLMSEGQVPEICPYCLEDDNVESPVIYMKENLYYPNGRRIITPELYKEDNEWLTKNGFTLYELPNDDDNLAEFNLLASKMVAGHEILIEGANFGSWFFRITASNVIYTYVFSTGSGDIRGYMNTLYPLLEKLSVNENYKTSLTEVKKVTKKFGKEMCELIRLDNRVEVYKTYDYKQNVWVEKVKPNVIQGTKEN